MNTTPSSIRYIYSTVILILWSCLLIEASVPVQLLSIIDGDTLRVKWNQKIVKIRLSGIDTPESQDNLKLWRDAKGNPTKASQLLQKGNLSTQFVCSLLHPGEIIYLDVSPEIYDKYGRTLGTIFLPNGTNLNALLVDKGYARVWVKAKQSTPPTTSPQFYWSKNKPPLQDTQSTTDPAPNLQ